MGYVPQRQLSNPRTCTAGHACKHMGDAGTHIHCYSVLSHCYTTQVTLLAHYMTLTFTVFHTQTHTHTHTHARTHTHTPPITSLSLTDTHTHTHRRELFWQSSPDARTHTHARTKKT